MEGRIRRIKREREMKNRKERKRNVIIKGVEIRKEGRRS